MSFDIQETSAIDGQPIELYEFTLSDEQFHYTSAEDEIVDGAATYIPIEISRTNILLGAETRQDVVTVKMPSSLDPATRYISIVPGQRGHLTIKRLHRTDGGTPEVITVFKGLIRAAGFSDNGYQAELAIVPLSTGMSREIPHYTFQGLCNHVLYDTRCKVLQSLFQFTGDVTVVDGKTLTIPGLNAEADGFYTGGFVQLGTTEWRLILEHTGNDVTLLIPFPSDLTSIEVDVFAGCSHTIAICDTKFDNVINYGGFAFVPLRNIFETGIDV